jgi:putative ABC transport system ATP-binding protein
MNNPNDANAKSAKDDLVLSARGVCKSFRQGRTDYPVLKDIDLDVHRGEFLAIMGQSGSGKSTLMHILGLMSRPTQAASLKIDGLETVGLGQARRTVVRREKIGFVFQRFNLLAVLNSRDNLRLALKLRNLAVDHQVDSLLDLVGLADRRHLKPGQMSIGEQQRLAFARAIIHRPAILLADEPTGNLDSENSEKLMALMQRARREFDQTVIMVTHNRELAMMADHTYTMKDGKFIHG